VRKRSADLRRRVNGDLSVEFTGKGLTSYSGLELLGRYLRGIAFNDLVRSELTGRIGGGDYGSIGFLRLLVGLITVGGRRLRHIDFLRGDGVFGRFCGLKALPTDRTVSRWLKTFRADGVAALQRLNANFVARVVRRFVGTRILTVDVDGTVLSTGMQAGWAFRGYNPHRRKVPSYFPISAYLAESGHILRHQNRPGNVSDGIASVTFLRGLFSQVRQTLGRRKLRFRMDGDYFKQNVLELLSAQGAEYAIKVPFWQCLGLQGKIKSRSRWTRVEEESDSFCTTVAVKKWNRTFKVVVFRKRVHHQTKKNFQLDLFDPDDGTWEYSAVATNTSFDARRLWRFMCGRGMHEKTIGELKSALALDTIPTNHYSANSAWQQIVVLAHNILTSFQIETGANQKPRTQKCTTLWFLKTANTLRFELFNRAGQLLRPAGRPVLRLTDTDRVRSGYIEILKALKAA